ncbi:hypothetical protein [Xylophilus sp. GOD-11R]|uniref:hypothetical protein n=1 Tax=Xylophilus sp. GOD-11R TaxID=3089814 RepID=UPI00298D35FE|nr:hypothetical protein [Xylophilus sp. GOD-11R]WPB59547.1 hypothetical protein R9X41_14490 [Xylophilus sp. GOD-11R]
MKLSAGTPLQTAKGRQFVGLQLPQEGRVFLGTFHVGSGIEAANVGPRSSAECQKFQAERGKQSAIHQSTHGLPPIARTRPAVRLDGGGDLARQVRGMGVDAVVRRLLRVDLAWEGGSCHKAGWVAGGWV